MKLGLVAATLALTMASAPAGAAVNLLSNGSFESGLTGWTLTQSGGGTAPVVFNYNSSAGYSSGAFGEPIPPSNVASASPDPVGNRVLYFSSDTANPDTLSQLVNLVAGATYNIGFDYYIPLNGFNNPFDATLRFSVGGTPVGATLQAGSTPGTAQTWFNFNSSFVATNTGPQTLAFEFRGLGVTAADFAVDRVFVTAAVPEPGTWAMMLLGFGVIGAAMRRRRQPLLQLA